MLALMRGELDDEALGAAADGARDVEVRRGGVASDIASIIQEEAFYHLDAPIEIVAGLNIPVPFNLELEKASIPQLPNIIAAVKRSLHLKPDAIAAE